MLVMGLRNKKKQETSKTKKSISFFEKTESTTKTTAVNSNCQIDSSISH